MKLFNNLNNTFKYSIVVAVMLSVGAVGTLWIYQEYRNNNTELTVLKEELLANQKSIIKKEVNRVMAYIDYKRVIMEDELKNNIQTNVDEAIDIANNLYATYKDTKSEDEIKTLIREALRPIRFNHDRGYYFIYDMRGNNILLPVSPHLEGRNLWELQDSKGMYPIRRFSHIIKEKGEGFLKWYWYRPGEIEHMSEKICFSKRFSPYNWWIGTGEYVEDFEKDVQKETLNWINNIRFGKDGYIFVYNFNAITLAHFNQENLGIDRSSYKDTNGIRVVHNLITLSKKADGGFLEYMSARRPTTGLPASKIGYARAVMDWEWTVGCGTYVDPINRIVALKRASLKKKIQTNLLSIVTILVILLVFLYFFYRVIAKKTTDNITVFTQFFDKAATESITIKEASLHFSEFKMLANSANKMIDERNRVTDSLSQLQEQVTRSKKMEELGVLVGGVVHDLNNILAGMVGYPDVLLTTLRKDSPYIKPIQAIKTSGEKMASIIQDLLTLTRRGAAKNITLSLNSIINNYLKSPEHKRVMRDNPGIDISSNLLPDLKNINGSQNHLQATLMNLVANAAEAQTNGGLIYISTENRYIAPNEKKYSKIKEGEYVQLTVKDEGVGISEKDLERIFEPFFTTKNSSKTSGTGLGMAVVWGTVQDHDGYIHISTTEKEGTSFELFFPITQDMLLDFEEPGDLEDICGNGEMVLVVDDMGEQLEIADVILKKLRYSTKTVNSGEAALEYLRRQKVDILVLDMHMEPGINGFDTFRRSLEINPNQKAIIASGSPENDLVKATKALGAGGYVQKPYSISSIGKAIKEEL